MPELVKALQKNPRRKKTKSLYIDKEGKHFITLMRSLMKNRRISYAVFKRKVPRSSYYKKITKKLARLNNACREFHELAYFVHGDINPNYGGTIDLILCPNISIIEHNDFFEVIYDEKTTIHTDHAKRGSI